MGSCTIRCACMRACRRSSEQADKVRQREAVRAQLMEITSAYKAAQAQARDAQQQLKCALPHPMAQLSGAGNLIVLLALCVPVARSGKRPTLREVWRMRGGGRMGE